MRKTCLMISWFDREEKHSTNSTTNPFERLQPNHSRDENEIICSLQLRQPKKKSENAVKAVHKRRTTAQQ